MGGSPCMRPVATAPTPAAANAQAAYKINTLGKGLDVLIPRFFSADDAERERGGKAAGQRI